MTSTGRTLRFTYTLFCYPGVVVKSKGKLILATQITVSISFKLYVFAFVHSCFNSMIKHISIKLKEK